MTWNNLRQQAMRAYYPALRLDRFVSRRRIIRLQRVASLCVWLTSIASIVAVTSTRYTFVFVDGWVISKVYGLFLLSVVFWVKTTVLEAFFNTYYFKDISSRGTMPIVPYDLAYVLYRSRAEDPLRGFLKSRVGKDSMRRLSLSRREVSYYLKKRKHIITANVLKTDDTPLTLSEYAVLLFERDTSFAAFLFSNGLRREALIWATAWVSENELSQKRKERWWSPEYLATIPRLGMDWLTSLEARLRPDAERKKDEIDIEEEKERSLSDASGRLIALQLNKYKRHLEVRGIHLSINEELIYYIHEHRKGTLKPLNKQMKDKIERAIAWKIKNYSLKPGSLVEFTEEELRIAMC